MTPITDDIVQKLIECLEARQAADAEATDHPEAGAMTARVLRFRIRRRSGAAPDAPADVLDLQGARKSRCADRTQTGLFLYRARL